METDPVSEILSFLVFKIPNDGKSPPHHNLLETHIRETMQQNIGLSDVSLLRNKKKSKVSKAIPVTGLGCL
jgi:hypothetical protein